jgi:hypothetical protein
LLTPEYTECDFVSATCDAPRTGSYLGHLENRAYGMQGMGMKKLRRKLASKDIDALPPIPLKELSDDLMAVADELRAAWGLDGFADAIDAIAEKVEDREELNRRKQELDKKMSDGRPRSADDLIRHARRDRRFQEDEADPQSRGYHVPGQENHCREE